MIAFSPLCLCVKILYPELVKEFEKTCCLAERRSIHSDCITSRYMTSETLYAMLKYRLYTTTNMKLRSKTLKWAFLFHWFEGSKVFPQTVAKTSVLGLGKLRGEEMKNVKTWSVVSQEARHFADLLLWNHLSNDLIIIQTRWNIHWCVWTHIRYTRSLFLCDNNCKILEFVCVCECWGVITSSDLIFMAACCVAALVLCVCVSVTTHLWIRTENDSFLGSSSSCECSHLTLLPWNRGGRAR